MLPWLKTNQVYIIIDSLGHSITRMVSHMINLHPQITHRDTLHDMIFDV